MGVASYVCGGGGGEGRHLAVYGGGRGLYTHHTIHTQDMHAD
jgi:hypothetical protein